MNLKRTLYGWMITLLVFGMMPMARPAGASGGVLEINQTCAVQTGCLDGDLPGFPVTLNQNAGRSYRLTGDLTVPAGQDGINIPSSTRAMTIDLGGFTIIGPQSCVAGSTSLSCSGPGSGQGIRMNSARSVTVRNGGIRGMDGGVISLSGQNATIRDLQIESISGYGLSVGASSLIENVNVARTELAGIRTSTGSIIRGSAVRFSGTSGFDLGQGTTVTDSTATQNFASGFIGFANVVIRNSSASNNDDDGITVGDGCILRGNSLDGNDRDGIRSGGRSIIEQNSIIDSGAIGLSTGEASVIIQNHVSDSGTLGIQALEGTSVIGNSVFSNGTQSLHDGIYCNLGCSVQDNAVRRNAGLGLRFDSGSSVYGGNSIGANSAGTVVNGRDGGGNVCETTLGCP